MPVPAASEVLRRADEAVRRRGSAALCQIVRAEGSTPGKVGWKLLLERGGESFGNLGGGAFEAMVCRDAGELLAAGRAVSRLKRYYFTESAVRGEPTGMVCGGMAEVLLEILTGPPVLAICGGGPVGQALAANATLLGFELVVAEDREEFRRPELFPPETRLVAVDRDFTSPFLAPWSERELSVAVVTRCWETDTAALAAVLRQPPPGLFYLGLMGSRRKVARVSAELASRGLDPRAVELHAPIGMPIGGTTPAEIAVSILAEVIRVRRRGTSEGSTLRSEAHVELEHVG